MLDEVGELTLTTAWKKIRGLIKEDPRYGKFSSSDRVTLFFKEPSKHLLIHLLMFQKCEKEFNEYMKDKMVAAKADFRELLKVIKFL